VAKEGSEIKQKYMAEYGRREDIGKRKCSTAPSDKYATRGN